ncbi:hypothetical protein H4S06_002821 [Coemansia sp. BCRC 34490]|nr:hypothetical protein H4S06_002821 [Coemansia sp. BCRC 34490]
MSGKRSYSSDRNDKDSKNSLTDTKHEILASRFVDIVRNAEAPPQKEHVQKVEIPEVIEEKLIQKMELLFSQNKPAVTEELLEARRKLREKYPKLFENIADEELDP